MRARVKGPESRAVTSPVAAAPDRAAPGRGRPCATVEGVRFPPPSPSREAGKEVQPVTAAPNVPVRPTTGDTAAARPVLSAPDVGRVVDRMAHELLEKTGGGEGVVLLGIPTRGRTLALRLAQRIEAFQGIVVPTGSLDITLYRDDLRLKSPRTLEQTELPPGGIDGTLVVLVDDVLFSGRTIRARIDPLAALGSPRPVHLPVLVDRGHRELPI